MQHSAAVNVYVITYVLTTIGAFGVVTLMSSPYNNKDEAGSLAEYRGLFWRRPVLTATLTVMMLSLAGIPLTAGFIGKFLVVKTAVAGRSSVLAAMVILGSGIGLYYYLTCDGCNVHDATRKPTYRRCRSLGSKSGWYHGAWCCCISIVDRCISRSNHCNFYKWHTFAISPELQQFILSLITKRF